MPRSRLRRGNGKAERRRRNRSSTRLIARSKRAEDAWEAEKAAPIRAMIPGAGASPLTPTGWAKVRAAVEKAWPTKNKTKRGFAVYGITKSMLSRVRRKVKSVREIVVAD